MTDPIGPFNLLGIDPIGRFDLHVTDPIGPFNLLGTDPIDSSFIFFSDCFEEMAFSVQTDSTE